MEGIVMCSNFAPNTFNNKFLSLCLSFSPFPLQLVALAPSSPSREKAFVCPAPLKAMLAQGHPAFAPVETVTTDQTWTLLTLHAPVSSHHFQPVFTLLC